MSIQEVFKKFLIIVLFSFLWNMDVNSGVSSIPIKLTIGSNGNIESARVVKDDITINIVAPLTPTATNYIANSNSLQLKVLSQQPTCNEQSKGQLISTIDGNFKFCNGTSWVSWQYLSCVTCNTGFQVNPAGCDLPCLACIVCSAGTFNDPTGCAKPCLPCSAKTCQFGQPNAITCACQEIPSSLDLTLLANNFGQTKYLKNTPYSITWNNQSAFPSGSYLRVISVTEKFPTCTGTIKFTGISNVVQLEGCFKDGSEYVYTMRLSSITIGAYSSANALFTQSTFAIDWIFSK